MENFKTVFVVKTSYLDACARNAAAYGTFAEAWASAHCIDPDHAAQLIDELPLMHAERKEGTGE